MPWKYWVCEKSKQRRKIHSDICFHVQCEWAMVTDKDNILCTYKSNSQKLAEKRGKTLKTT